MLYTYLFMLWLNIDGYMRIYKMYISAASCPTCIFPRHPVPRIYLLFIIYYLLFIIYYLLFSIYYLVFII